MGLRSIIPGFYTLVPNKTETEDQRNKWKRKQTAFKLHCTDKQESCAGIVRLCRMTELGFDINNLSEKKIEPLKYTLSMTKDGNKMLAVKIPYVLFTEFITYQISFESKDADCLEANFC